MYVCIGVRRSISCFILKHFVTAFVNIYMRLLTLYNKIKLLLQQRNFPCDVPFLYVHTYSIQWRERGEKWGEGREL
jgi:hypothetical protein